MQAVGLPANSSVDYSCCVVFHFKQLLLVVGDDRTTALEVCLNS